MLKNFQICTTVKQLRAHLKHGTLRGQRIGFVPTMGALHEGHLSLARTLREHCDVRVCSIFVNPKQFNDPRDYQAYTVNLIRDEELLRQEEVDVLFLPSVEEMFPNSFQTLVRVGKLSGPFEGERRPGHFDGVSTVVALLFLQVQPNVAIFGEKDFQQLRVIEQLVQDMQFPIEIIRGTLVRDDNGLALSSRNVRLSTEGKTRALGISRGLFSARDAFETGERSAVNLETLARTSMLQSGVSDIEYLAIVEEETLSPLLQLDRPARMLVAAQVEGVRLLDNIALTQKQS